MNGPTPPPTHRIEVAAHRLGRHTVAALMIEIPAVSIDHARLLGVKEAHRRAQVPPWRPYVRRSLDYASTGSEPAQVIPLATPPAAQLELFDRRAA